MAVFQTEHFILLSNEEINHLVQAENRNKYQPVLSSFLYAVKNLTALRRLSFSSEKGLWAPPSFSLTDRDEVLDQFGKCRGRYYSYPLPARPGEPQMALSHDWFWSEFSMFLNETGVWTYTNESEFIVVAPDKQRFSIKEKWVQFWKKLSSTKHLKQSLNLFLNNKTLFKKPAIAKPWDSHDIPVLSENMADFLIRYYQSGQSRKKHFRQGSIKNAIADLKDTIQKGDYEIVPMIPMKKDLHHVRGGDFYTGEKYIRCAACGEFLLKKDGVKQLAIFLKDADERLQSAAQKDQKPHYCKRCVATVFLCPVKLAPETLTIRLAKNDNSPYSETEMVLKKFVAQTLHVHAGNFLSLHLDESIKRKPLIQVWGAYHYALWKIAVTFPPELFAQNFRVQVYPGEESFRLPSWILWFISSLASWDNVLKINAYRNFDVPFSKFLRLVAQQKVFQAFYVLIANDIIKSHYSHTWKINALQEIWGGLERMLTQNSEKEEHMPLPDYPRIAGFAGLLLPLAQRVESSKKAENEKKIAVGKLLEEVDKPIQYAYTAARESGSTEFIFKKRPGNHYFFEKAMQLMAWAGEDVETLKKQSIEKAKKLIEKDGKSFSWLDGDGDMAFISADQIARVTSALVCEGEAPPYESEADWRSFAYQVKLALWSMFPRYLGSKS